MERPVPGRYADYLKGGLELSKTAACRITGSADLYDPASRGSHASVNFLNCHDGFTLWDMYSYSQKHNEANGWCNLDGSDDNGAGTAEPKAIPATRLFWG